MPCDTPLKGVHYFDAATGSNRVRVVGKDTRESLGKDALQLPCGRCMGCRLEYGRQWAIRISHEQQMHDKNCFITLTYNQECLPPGGSLVKQDYQQFMKRLRWHFSEKRVNPETGRKKRYYKPIRYYHCGEYGDKTRRPHYHAALFGVDFEDLEPVLYNSNSQQWIYSSGTLADIWKMGNVTVGELTWESASYLAHYITKKVTGDMAEDHYCHVNELTGEITQRQPEYVTMSLKPGIGATWLDKYGETDCFRGDQVVINGRPQKPPKYYDSVFEAEHPEEFHAAKALRREQGEQSRQDRTPARLQTRAKVRDSKRGNYSRDINNHGDFSL